MEEEDIDSGENALGLVGESKQINSISFPGADARWRQMSGAGEGETKQPTPKEANLIKLPSPKNRRRKNPEVKQMTENEQ